jgi:hypothetical protein
VALEMKAFVVAAALLADVAYASAETLLVCRYETQREGLGSAKATSGEMGVTFEFLRQVGQQPNVVVRTTTGFCINLFADGDDLTITARCTTTYEDIELRRTLTLDRVTGVFHEELTNNKGKEPVMYYGRCVRRPRAF